ncbi:MAG: 4'-phosphopantetheinyl transferase superfamily protein [Lachnospiraceae bacterium]|nr:4'-phosphopantetheinyl transferase superfamily protein [Lachnospiraceae bacterium]
MLRVYLLHTDELKDLAVNEDLFSAQRKEKIQKLKHEDDKQLSKGVELLLMYGLKQIDPSVHFPLSIKEEESGNLLLENQLDPPVFFNLSHAKEYAACAIADKPVGIDVECVKTREVQHMDRILHPQEVMIQGFITNPEEKKKFFYECWVTKESYLKNLRCGLTVRPSEFAVNEDKLETEKSELENRYVHIYKAGEIENADWKFDASYRLAVCTEKKEEDAVVRILHADDLKDLK